MEHETIRYTATEGIGRITLCRPEAMNAMTPTMLNEIRAAILKAGEDETASVLPEPWKSSWLAT